MVQSGISFERTHDWELVKKIATHPKNWTHIGDDFAPEPSKWEPNKSDDVWYILARDGGELLGLFVIFPENAVCWRIHMCMLPVGYGERAHAAGRGIVEWVWNNTPCRRIVASICEDNRLALAFALSSGFIGFGMNEKSWLKDGELKNLIMLGVSKE